MEYNVPIKSRMIPSTLRELTLPTNYNHPLHEVHLSNNCPYYTPVFPVYGLTKLYITNSFNQPILPNVLPRTLRELKIGVSFTQELYFESIPNSVTFLNLNCPNYNHQLVPRILPRNLKKLKMCNNVPLLAGSLPDSITYLKLGGHFNHPITPNVLPKSLQKISFGPSFNSNFVPPENVHTIIFGEAMTCEPQNFTNNVRCVVVNNSHYSELPNTINELIINAEKKRHKRFPVNLNYLELICPNPFEFRNDELQPLTHLKHLRLLDAYIRINVAQIPISLVSLDLECIDTDDPLENLDLSPLVNLQLFSLGDVHPVNATFPPSLRAIKFYGTQQEVFANNYFPATLEILQLSRYHVQPLSNTWLPSSLKILIHPGEPVIAEDYRHPNLLKFYISYRNRSVIRDSDFINANYRIMDTYKTKHGVIIEDLLNFDLPFQRKDRYSNRFYMANN
ncbi:hypothetical protein DICPUDRAFT_91810 [Dictyostelium purpureum]|uniref:FNIP repeat-containing protein n=1 Tax=Dictyostelium purpureum TaxID=5786 RepID=F0ZHN1_DICPU|nr:uncharacterized protein DICPUDRAFT_91810 [Dictyostelium purpureum]EGC36560.1 hypothetical protein DICPUDRAFT_91810 [Dictyostelium purpureum]|eukprot:XP_003286932.1 hypothetical protein DICPUDRAFT_91810 [Dictyostelium purpureum]